MLKDAIQYLVSLKDNKTYTINGETYSDRELHRIPRYVPHPFSLGVSGLDSIVKLVRNELDMFDNLPLFIRVDGARMQMQVEASKLEQIINDCCTEFSENGNTLLVNDGEYLYSASLLRRMGKVDDISNLRREAARKRWENKPCKTSGNSDGCSDDANAGQEQSKEKKSKEKQSKAEQRKEKQNIFSDFACGDADLLSALQGFEEMRVKIKKPMTDQAKKRLLTELEKLAPGDRETQIAILHQSEDRCWAGVFALKDDRGGQIGGGRRQQASTGDKMGALRDLHDAFSGDGGV